MRGGRGRGDEGDEGIEGIEEFGVSFLASSPRFPHTPPL